MKKGLVVLPLAVLLLALTIGVASAGYAYEDPALCVNGQWLLVDAAHPSAVTVFLPENTVYGDQVAGGCATPGPSAPLLTVVKERGEGHSMLVRVEGKNASTPTINVTYGARSVTKDNNGKQVLNFTFALP
jgi:hypothetical protein